MPTFFDARFDVSTCMVVHMGLVMLAAMWSVVERRLQDSLSDSDSVVMMLRVMAMNMMMRLRVEEDASR